MISFEEMKQKIEGMKGTGEVDLSRDEDLSIALMNLISLEEHFFFTGEKTKKDDYFEFLNEVRMMRRELLEKMIPAHEGETWCISKHLLAASMRIMEVGTKLLGSGKKEEAQRMFDLAYKTYSLFWGLRLKLIDLSNMKQIPDEALHAGDEGTKKPWTYEDIVGKLVDCCDEGQSKKE